MGDSYITRRGNRSSDIFAMISVSYPQGSVCTCTKGSKVLKAKNTEGAYIFSIPEAGTWTVSCTDGTRSSTKSITIISEYEIQRVTLGYSIIIYDNGVIYYPLVDTQTENFGGYTKLSYRHNVLDSIVEYNTDNIYIFAEEKSGGSGSIQFIGTANPIDISNYSTLYVEFDEITDDNSGEYLYVSASPNKYFQADGSGDAFLKINQNKTNYIAELDISALEEAYITITLKTWFSGSSHHATIKRIYTSEVE